MASRAIRFAHVPHTAGEPKGPGVPDGAWWPRSRTLAAELEHLLRAWPGSEPRIKRVLVSRPDWDDTPRKVQVGGRWFKVGSFPDDDTHLITLLLSNGTQRRIQVIAPDTGAVAAADILAAITHGAT